MHQMDVIVRRDILKSGFGFAPCNISKCVTFGGGSVIVLNGQGDFNEAAKRRHPSGILLICLLDR